ncbi:MAG: hypothetical protein KKH74_00155 [Gammaproteobacteria bacterium]|nr:hypothetical protein [Gammaproteobacteria bacterium]MBU1730697.1 hypothetical protein [Gammaproteobacteria bacterium]MBU1893201.1 hypothetical protein [Gammaproteobacteria bacterium]
MTAQANDNIIDITPQLEDDHLAQAHGLVRTTAYVVSPARKKEQKEGAARRMAEMRERKKAAGLVMCELPMAMAEAIKAAGSPEAWLASLQVKQEPQIVEVEKIVEVVKSDTAMLDKAQSKIVALKEALDQRQQMLEEIYDMSLLDRILGRWPWN